MTTKFLGSSIFFAVVFSVAPPAWSFTDKSFGVGVGYYSQNIMNRVSQNETGATGFMGETSYPFNFKYDFAIGMSSFFAPQLSYTAIPRSAPGSTAKMSLTHLVFLFGQNFGDMGSKWDWYFGPGFMQEEYKGAGGTVVMNNGTSTSVFGQPGNTASTKKLTLNLGSSFTFDSSRIGLDLIIENAAKSGKRSQSMMLSYSYLFGGGMY